MKKCNNIIDSGRTVRLHCGEIMKLGKVWIEECGHWVLCAAANWTVCSVGYTRARYVPNKTLYLY